MPVVGELTRPATARPFWSQSASSRSGLWYDYHVPIAYGHVSTILPGVVLSMGMLFSEGSARGGWLSVSGGSDAPTPRAVTFTSDPAARVQLGFEIHAELGRLAAGHVHRVKLPATCLEDAEHKEDPRELVG